MVARPPLPCVTHRFSLLSDVSRGLGHAVKADIYGNDMVELAASRSGSGYPWKASCLANKKPLDKGGGDVEAYLEKGTYLPDTCRGTTTFSTFLLFAKNARIRRT